MVSKPKSKRLSSPVSTGGGGAYFEAHVQSSFVTLMLTGGNAPCLRCWPIVRIKLQGKIDGFETDDLIVTVRNGTTGAEQRLLGQIKHSVKITKSSHDFSEVILSAWNDFNNSNIFDKDKDIIALITGPLSKSDTYNVQWLLEQARHSNGVDDFFRKVEQTNFSSQESRNKLGVIRYHLKAASENTDVTNDDLYSFLKCFYLLGYDLGKENGVVLSLLHSHISQYRKKEPQLLWCSIVNYVQDSNQHAGTITPDSLPSELKEAFQQTVVSSIPNELLVKQEEPSTTNWSQHQYAKEIALVNLVGAWDEKNKADIVILTGILETDYCTWERKAREILQVSKSPLALVNGQWKLKERAELWYLLGSFIFDQNLDSFRSAVVSVLSERDPSFDLPSKDRFASSIHGKILVHSHLLRKGLADALALLGNDPGVLIHCSWEKAQITASLAVREILFGADWAVWGSLNSLLPNLAEAAPNEFLNAVENALQESQCPFNELFAQEGDGLLGGNYLTGLLSALEALAWDEEHFIRSFMILGELANHDPGGRLANRPESSLTTILLPWLPQTTAPIEKRIVAVQSLSKELPNISWRLLISLLPNERQISFGSHKPTWRKSIVEDKKKGVSIEEYWKQIAAYAELAISAACEDTSRLADLVDSLDKLPLSSFKRLLEVLSSELVTKLPEEIRLIVWEHLTRLISKHRRFADAKWALDKEKLSSIETVATCLAPINPSNRYRYLFSNSDFDLYEEKGEWGELQEKLVKNRQKAICEIMENGGINEVIQFVKLITLPEEVGHTLANSAAYGVDYEIIPAYLATEDQPLTAFTRGFISGRCNNKGWTWADEFDRSKWSNKQIAHFLTCLPFDKGSWDRANQWLGESQGEYWSIANVNVGSADFVYDVAVEKLIEYGRPHAAIYCLDRMMHKKHPINTKQCVQALLAALSSNEPDYTMDRHSIVELIQFLQTKTNESQEDLFRLEWAYLPLLDHHSGAAPKLLEKQLASDPSFFCEVIQLVYKSERADEKRKELSENRKALATNAWRLLHEWRTIPGTQEDGSFSEKQFTNWIEHVERMCKETGHLEVALIAIGNNLVNSPPDNNGLWINRIIAEALNSRNAKDMRDAYTTGLYNTRGFHTVDPDGNQEKELARQYGQRADDVENAGFHRLAASLRELARGYEGEAGGIIYKNSMESENID